MEIEHSTIPSGGGPGWIRSRLIYMYQPFWGGGGPTPKWDPIGVDPQPYRIDPKDRTQGSRGK